jgi:hypothetical protein
MDPAQQEFNSLIQGKNPETTPPTPEEVLEFNLGDQSFKVPYSYEIPIKHNGQIIKAPIEKVLNAFRERSHLTDKYTQFKKEREEFDGQRKQFQDFDILRQKYGAIQDWSEKNPDQWNKLWELFQQRDQLLNNPQDPTIAELNSMRKELMELKSFRDEWSKNLEEQEIQTNVNEINKEIEDFSSTYGKKYGIDLTQKDDEGVSLKARIIQFGIDKGYPDFKSAALTFLSDRLLGSAIQNGKNEIANSIKNDRKAGIVARSDTPFGGETKIDPRKLSEGDRFNMALNELNKTIAARG